MSSINTDDIFADIYNGHDEFGRNLTVIFANNYLLFIPDLGVFYKSIDELKQKGINITGFKKTGEKEDWAYPIDTASQLTHSLQITVSQRNFITRLFRRNNVDYKDIYGDLITVEDRIKYLTSGPYSREYNPYRHNKYSIDSQEEIIYLKRVEITLGDGITRTIPYFHPDPDSDSPKPFDVSRNLGHLGPNFAIDGVLTCGDKIIMILRRPRDAKGSVTSRVGDSRTISSLISAGTPASAAFAGGMLETLAGLFCLIKEMMEEAGLTPEDLFGERCPTLLKTINWARLNDDGTPATMAQIIQTLSEDKRDDAEYVFSQWLNPYSFPYQATIYGASIKNADLNPKNFTSAELLRTYNYKLFAKLIEPSIREYDDKTSYELVEEAMKFLLNDSDIAFDLQIMENDPRNSSIAFMVSCGLQIEITPETYQKLVDIYNSATPNVNSVSNSESAGLCVVSARELAKYYNNPELYQRALDMGAIDCDKNKTIEVTNLFTDSAIPVWRTHLGTLINVAHNIIKKIDNPVNNE